MGEDRLRVEYDKEADILYIGFRRAGVANTIPVSDDVYMDLGEDGRPVGLEIWRASENAISPLSKIIAEHLKSIIER